MTITTVTYDTPIDGRILKTAVTAADGILLSYILAKELIYDELGEGRAAYSVFAASYNKECAKGEDSGESESAFVRDLTSSESEALEFFSLITEGAVTPCTLLYVAEDYVASR